MEDSNSYKQVISPPRAWSFTDFSELYRFRQLLFSLAWKDIKVRYAQTFIGVLWAVIQPLMTIVLLSFVFQKVAKVSTGGIPPLLFNLVGFAAWGYFSALLTNAGNSVIQAQGMIQKIYFPRLVLPISKAISGLIELGVVLIIIILLCLYYQQWPSSNIIYLPIFLVLAIICGLAGGIWISALTVRFRDFRFVTPFLMQIGLFVTPIAYPASEVPLQYQSLFYLNPMAGIVEGFRWCILGEGNLTSAVIWSSALTIVLLLSGLLYFSRVEKIMADII